MKKDCKNETIRYLKANLHRGIGTDRRDRVEMVGMGFSWPNVGMIHGFDHLLGYNPLRMDATSRAVGAGETIAGWNQRTFSPLSIFQVVGAVLLAATPLACGPRYCGQLSSATNGRTPTETKASSKIVNFIRCLKNYRAR